MEVDDNGGRSRKDAGGDSRRDEPSFDFSSGDTAGEEAVPAQPRVQVQLVVLETLPRLHDLMFLVAKVPRLILAVQVQTKGRHRYLVLLHLSEEHIAANFSSTSIAASRPGSTSTDESSSCPRSSSGSLTSASFPPWVQPYLDMPFTAPGAKSCFERVLSKVLPDPSR
ncbi:hypothetical protein GQ600_1956 [Phytophthora cactorum]|nr:hypothetical protein GQ600_1956 [Phytophthora cactorum]